MTAVCDVQYPVKYSAMCRAISVCREVDEVKEYRDKAMAMEVYAKQAMNTEAERQAAEIRIRAERRAGQLLKAMSDEGMMAKGAADGTPGPGRGKNAVAPIDRVSANKKLSDMGVSKDQSSKWQSLAEVPDDEFEKSMDGDKKLSTAGIIRDSSTKKPIKKFPREVLWVLGVLRDVSTEPAYQMSAEEIVCEMTEAMRSKAIITADENADFFNELRRALHEYE